MRDTERERERERERQREGWRDAVTELYTTRSDRWSEHRQPLRNLTLLGQERSYGSIEKVRPVGDSHHNEELQ